MGVKDDAIFSSQLPVEAKRSSLREEADFPNLIILTSIKGSSS